MFVPMALTLLTAPLLWKQGLLYRAAALGQFALHSAAILGYIKRESPLGKSKVLSLPYFLDMTNLASILAVKSLLRGEIRDVWEAERALEDGHQGSEPGK